MSAPLEGFRVIEVAGWAYVPSAGAVLADWGAEVIKVEPPTGDPMRGLTAGGVHRREGLVPSWEMFNRGKQAIALDLKNPVAQEIVHELVAGADVFLTSVLHGARAGLGIDDETIRLLNPRIVYGSGSGVGARGPEAGNGGFDAITFWSRGGLSAAVTPDDAAPTSLPSGAFGDSISGMALAGGIAAALAQRGATGQGSLVDGSLLATALWSMQMSIVNTALTGRAPNRMTRDNVMNPLVNTYQTSDGRWIALCMLQIDKFWAPFCSALGRSDLATDARFESSEERRSNLSAAIAEMDATFASRPLDEWIPVLSAQDGQWDVVRHVPEILEDQQALANGYLQSVDYGNDRAVTLVSNPVQFDGAPPNLRPAPEFGAQTDEVLLGLGWSWDRIIEAKLAGAVH